jgi:hypothetical protein
MLRDPSNRHPWAVLCGGGIIVLVADVDAGGRSMSAVAERSAGSYGRAACASHPACPTHSRFFFFFVSTPHTLLLLSATSRLQIFDPHGTLGADESGTGTLITLGRGGFGWVDAESALLGCAEVSAESSQRVKPSDSMMRVLVFLTAWHCFHDGPRRVVHGDELDCHCV